MSFRSLALLVPFLAACSDKAPSVPDRSAAAGSDVRHFGTVHAVMNGQWAPAVSLKEGLSGADAYGLGALSDLRGEFVAMPGEVWLSFPTTSALPRVDKGAIPDETAALLVAANAATLRRAHFDVDVASADVDARIATLAASLGTDVSKPFLFVVEGNLRAVHWHVVDGTRVPPGTRPNESAQKGVVQNGEATIVGFHSESHQGIFTMMGQRTHMHAAFADGSVAGHVESLEIPAGATLAVP